MKRGPSSVVVCLIVLAGCSGPSAPTEQGGGAVLDESQPQAMRTRGWLEFSDLSLRPKSDGGEPRGPHIHGWILGGTFAPEGDVVGGGAKPPSGRILTHGFLELRTRAFVRKESPHPPAPPYVEGVQDAETGAFFPTSSVQHASSPNGNG